MPNMQLINALAVAMSVTPAAAAIKGFNYGSTFTDSSVKVQSDFENEFKTAKGLVGAEDFTSARLYTMIQGGTTNTPISAIPAAIKQNTTLLLGLWASGDTFDDEVAALKSAISTYGDDLAGLVVGISVGSEDLYRDSEMGIKAKAGIGKGPDDIVNDINTVRSAISGTKLAQAPIGHVDTWTAWANGSNKAVIDAVDWIGLDAYPYFQDTDANDISNGKSLFQDAINNVNAASNGKSLWVTETGWPISGPNYGQGVPSVENAKTYWDQVGCGLLFDKINTYWYILQDAAPTTPSPSFGIVGSQLTTNPIYNLTCPAVTSTSTSASGSATATKGSSSGSAGSTPTPTPTPVSTPSGAATSPSGTPTGTASGTASGFTSSASKGTSPATATGSSATGSSSTGGSSGNGSGSSSGKSTGTSTGTTPSFTGGASTVSTSVMGIVAALFAAVAAF
jgi:glucan endo-1,3-beta-D-glucosidase